MFTKKKLLVAMSLMLLMGGITQMNAQKNNRDMADLPIEELAKNRTRNLDKIIGMTPDQEDLVVKVYETFLNNQKELRKKYDAKDEEMETGLNKIRAQFNESLKEILNKEQFDMFLEHSKKRRQRGKNRRN